MTSTWVLFEEDDEVEDDDDDDADVSSSEAAATRAASEKKANFMGRVQGARRAAIGQNRLFKLAMQGWDVGCAGLHITGICRRWNADFTPEMPATRERQGEQCSRLRCGCVADQPVEGPCISARCPAASGESRDLDPFDTGGPTHVT